MSPGMYYVMAGQAFQTSQGSENPHRGLASLRRHHRRFPTKVATRPPNAFPLTLLRGSNTTVRLIARRTRPTVAESMSSNMGTPMLTDDQARLLEDALIAVRQQTVLMRKCLDTPGKLMDALKCW